MGNVEISYMGQYPLSYPRVPLVEHQMEYENKVRQIKDALEAEQEFSGYLDLYSVQFAGEVCLDGNFTAVDLRRIADAMDELSEVWRLLSGNPDAQSTFDGMAYMVK